MRADPTKLGQILINLLSNAAKFTTDGTVWLDVRRVETDLTTSIEFVVTDTGIGITAEQQQRLFQPFVQADASTARKYGGTGLGLALVGRFCSLMGGDVRVDSPSEGGARFTVRLPAVVTPLHDHGAAAPFIDPAMASGASSPHSLLAAGPS
jgi:signal transduction histidine kinase